MYQKPTTQAELDSEELQRDANARLIAAAPELLEACRELLESHETCDVSNGPDCNCGRCLCCKARAAIRKAEGRTA